MTRCPCVDCGTTENNEWPSTYKTYSGYSRPTQSTPLLVDFSVGIYKGSPSNTVFSAPYTWLYNFAREEILRITTAEHNNKRLSYFLFGLQDDGTYINWPRTTGLCDTTAPPDK